MVPRTALDVTPGAKLRAARRTAESMIREVRLGCLHGGDDDLPASRHHQLPARRRASPPGIEAGSSSSIAELVQSGTSGMSPKAPNFSA